MRAARGECATAAGELRARMMTDVKEMEGSEYGEDDEDEGRGPRAG